MSTLLRGNRDLIKAMNRNLILNIIRREGQLSRTQLTEKSGLSGGSISQIINELLDNHWVLEVGEGEYTGGRRQVLLRLNPKAGYAIGMKLMENRVVGAVTNFAAEVLHYDEQLQDFDENPYHLSRFLTDFIERIVTAAKIPRKKMFGVGMGLAGVIYPQVGVVHYSPFFGWRDVPLAALLTRDSGYPTYVENDVNTLTLTEQLFGSGRHHTNFVVVTIGRGIGMGMVINGQLYQGSKGGAGELGHIVTESAAGLTLETQASDPRVIADVRAAGHSVDTLMDVVALAQGGNTAAINALAESGRILGIGLANVINVLCPELVIISGEGVAAGDFRLKPMYNALRQHTFNGLLDDVEVIVEPTDDRAWSRGAASVVIGKVFESPILEARVDG